VRAATISGSVVATAAITLAASGEPAEAASFDAALIKDINPGGSSFPDHTVAIGSTLFFAADDGTNGVELWKSDGTEAGTQMVKDINQTSYAGGGSHPDQLTDVGGTLFFTAADGPENGTTHGYELWMSDGTYDGTKMVKNIHTTVSYPGGPRDLTAVGNTVIFSANDGPSTNFEPWRSDGSDSGTQKIEDINAAGGSGPEDFTNVNGTVFFSATDGTDTTPTATPPNGIELWKTEAPFTDATLVKDISPSGASNPYGLTDVNGTLFFSADDGTYGYEIWKSDGSGTGTVRVSDINPDAGDSYASHLTAVGNTLFFSATDGGTYGYELWSSDGTGAQLVKDIDPSGNGYPYYLTDFGGSLFFSAYDGSNRELWKSASPFDAASTALFKDINPSGGGYPGYLTPVGSTLFFSGYDSTNGTELWSSDGTAAGTELVQDINPGAAESRPGELTDVNGTLFFAADDGTHGYELWKTIPVVPPAGGGGPAPVTTAPALNLKAAIRKCKKKFPKGPKRKKCIRKARARAGL
jgi:ELWxxDGT repeat protein